MKGALFVATCVFWAAQVSAPVFNRYFPSVYVTEEHPVSVANVIAPVAGFLSLFAAYWLHKTIAPTKGITCQDVAFMVFLNLTAAGHGAHIVLVMIEDASDHVHPSVQSLVFFLHEHVSHNAFQIGFYGMMTLLLWQEMGVALRSADDTAKRPRQKSGAGTLPPTATIGRLTGCILLGTFLSIFGVETSTQVVTVAFYVLCLTVVAYATRSLGIGGVWRLYLTSELLFCGLLTQAALAGLVVMAAY